MDSNWRKGRAQNIYMLKEIKSKWTDICVICSKIHGYRVVTFLRFTHTALLVYIESEKDVVIVMFSSNVKDMIKLSDGSNYPGKL